MANAGIDKKEGTLNFFLAFPEGEFFLQRASNQLKIVGGQYCLLFSLFGLVSIHKYLYLFSA